LVVIVVIAILATITIVAYNGIQQRAQTAAYASAADEIDKQIMLQFAQGDGPTFLEGVGGENSAAASVCIGVAEDFPATADFAKGECRKDTQADGTVTSFTVDPALEAHITQAGIQLPKGLPTVKMTIPGSDSIVSRGFVMTVASGAPIWMVWLTPDMSSCSRGAGEFSYAIAQIKDDPALVQQYTDQYGPNWETVITGGGDLCILPFDVN